MNQNTNQIFPTVIFLSLISIASAAETNSSPTACGLSWKYCQKAFSYGMGVNDSLAFGSLNNISVWYNYKFKIPSGSRIKSVKVSLLPGKESIFGKMFVQASKNNGSTYGAWRIVPITGKDKYSVDITHDGTWTTSNINKMKIKVKCSAKICAVDWLPVIVNYNNS